MKTPTYWEILGVPAGASISHVKDSYRLLTRKSHATDVAYAILTDPVKRGEYVTAQSHSSEGDRDWGRRGRERCSCGVVLEIDDEWNCQTCWAKLDYHVVLGPVGAHIIHDSEIPLVTTPEGESYYEVPYSGELHGPFTIFEATEFARRHNELTDQI